MSARIDPDTKPVLVVATVTTGVLALASFALSFAGLVAVAAWAGVTTPLAWLVPVMIDGAIGVYTLAVLVQRARHESTRLAWSALALWTAVSVMGNAAHGYAPPEDVRRLVGMVVVGLAPIALLLAIHTIADLLVARPDAASERPDVPVVRIDPDALDRVRTQRPDARPVEVVRHTRRPAKRPTKRPARTPSDKADQARAMRAAGQSVRSIATALGLAPSTVYDLTRSEAAS